MMLSPILLGRLADSVGLAPAFLIVPVFAIAALIAIRLADPQPAPTEPGGIPDES